MDQNTIPEPILDSANFSGGYGLDDVPQKFPETPAQSPTQTQPESTQATPPTQTQPGSEGKQPDDNAPNIDYELAAYNVEKFAAKQGWQLTPEQVKEWADRGDEGYFDFVEQTVAQKFQLQSKVALDLENYVRANGPGSESKFLEALMGQINQPINGESAIVQDLKSRGYNDQEIKEWIDEVKADGTFEKEAKKALKSIETLTRAQAAKQAEERAAYNQQIMEAEKKFREDVANKVWNTRELFGIPVNQQEFFNHSYRYLFPDEKGNIPFEADLAKPEVQAIIAFMGMHKWDPSKIVSHLAPKLQNKGKEEMWNKIREQRPSQPLTQPDYSPNKQQEIPDPVGYRPY